MSRDNVTPAAAERIPVIAAMFPATTFGTVILSPPTIMLTCCTRSGFAAPIAYTDSPWLIAPEYNLPTATSPACGSIQILVIIIASSASGSQLTIALPIGVSRSPVQMFGIRYGCASTGPGSLVTAMSRSTS